MAAKQTFGPQMRKRARALYEEGHGCNAIARTLGFSAFTISRWAQAEGLRFDRSQTALATRAHVIDLKHAAALLAKKAAVVASDMLDETDQPYIHRELGGEFRDRYIELQLDRPPIDVRRSILTSAGIAIDKAVKVSDTSLEGIASTRSMITAVAEQIGLKLDA